MSKAKQNRILGSFALAMISVAAIVNLSGLPLMASVGLSAIFFYALAALTLLLPSALVCAELASTWPQAGGLYNWISRAFGDGIGFFAIWFEWSNNVIAIPVTLSFITATMAYLFMPQLAHNRIYLFTTMLAILWMGTFLNFFGIKLSSRINILGAILGTLLPAFVIICLGLVWFSSGKHIALHFSWSGILPAWHTNNLVFFIGVLSAYAGIQITSFYAQNVKNPGKTFPKAIAIAVILIFLATTLPAMAIALVVPHGKLSLVSGLMQGFTGFFTRFHIPWAVKIVALLTVFGGFSALIAWLLAPAKGLQVAAKKGYLPAWLAYENKRQIPTNILLLQAVFGTLLASLFLLMPTINAAFWELLLLTSQFTLVTYIILFAAAIRMRYKFKNMHRPYRIPGKYNTGMWLVGLIGIVVCCVALMISFVQPAQLHSESVFWYETSLSLFDLVYLLIPLILYFVYKKRGNKYVFNAI